MIYVDKAGHLVTDGCLHELHRFALSIGLKLAWFQSHPKHPHYDLTTARKRNIALKMGAKLVSSKFIVNMFKNNHPSSSA